MTDKNMDKILVIDNGNTSTKFGLFVGEELKIFWDEDTLKLKNSFFQAKQVLSYLIKNNIELQEIEKIGISSVVPSLKYFWINLAKFLKKEIIFLSPGLNTTIEIDYQPVNEVGADRIANVYAVKKNYSLPCLVIDFGTALTYDFIDENGKYCGGIIFPGPKLCLEILVRQTALLPLLSLKKQKGQLIAHNTQESIENGIFFGFVSQIEKIIEKMKNEINKNLFVLATGGFVSLFAPQIPSINKVDENLTLQGIRIFVEEKLKKTSKN